MAGRKPDKVIKYAFVFFIAVSFGIVPLSVSFNDNVGIRIEIAEPSGMLHFGDTVKLKCYISGISEPYFIQWQYMSAPDGDLFESEIHKLPLWENAGSSDDIYEYVLTPENVGYLYRVVVCCPDRTYAASSTDL